MKKNLSTYIFYSYLLTNRQCVLEYFFFFNNCISNFVYFRVYSYSISLSYFFEYFLCKMFISSASSCQISRMVLFLFFFIENKKRERKIRNTKNSHVD